MGMYFGTRFAGFAVSVRIPRKAQQMSCQRASLTFVQVGQLQRQNGELYKPGTVKTMADVLQVSILQPFTH